MASGRPRFPAPPGSAEPGGPGVPGAAGPPGGRKANWLSDLWHHHPWLVGIGVGAAAVGGFVFYEKNFGKQSKQASAGQGGGRGGDHLSRQTAVYRQGGGGHDHRRHHDRIHGGGADTQAGGDQAGADDQALMDQMGTLQDSIAEYTLARARGVSPGGPNPGPQAPGMGTRNTSAEVPSFGSVPMP